MNNLKQHAKNQAEITKLLAETARINNENKWYRMILGGSLALVIVAAAKFLI
jgi:hypothetical protein